MDGTIQATFAERSGDPRGFWSRFFGGYLRDILDRPWRRACRLAAARLWGASQIGDGWEIARGGRRVGWAEVLALAIGNQPPDPSLFRPQPARGFIDNPWGEEAEAAVRDAASSGGDVLLVGTGLTMVDAMLSLAAAGQAAVWSRSPAAAKVQVPCGL